MPEMRAAKARYFRGDEMGVKPEPVAATPIALNAAPNTKDLDTGNVLPSEDNPVAAQKIWRH